MTIDDGHRRSRSTSRDIERYAALFAERTKVMKSSAMRDLMALTERDEVISLAGGLPDTSTFPPDSYAALMGQVAAESCARALQYAPTEGLEVVKRCILDVMGAEGMHGVDMDEILVTTGGQQVIDLVCKTLIDPGDVIVAEAPTYPGAVPTFCAYQADVVQVAMDRDGMRVDEMEATLDRLEAEGRRPKFIYTVPTFQNPAGVTMALARRERLVRIADERELLVLEDNPYGLLRYEGEPVPTLRALDGGEFVIYLGTFSKILSPGIRLGWAVAPRPVLAKMNIGKQAADLCSSSMTQHFVAAYFDDGRWQEYVRSLAEIYRRRRDTMLDALAEHLPPEAEWTHPAGGLFVWATLPDYIDTTDLLARALQENVAFVPGRAAFLDGRGGSSMRLNFSGVSQDEIREGVRRIGKVVREQVGLYGTLIGGQAPSGQAPAAPDPPEPDPRLADVLELPERRRARRKGA
jgi:2-aminoadipate transaminase